MLVVAGLINGHLPRNKKEPLSQYLSAGFRIVLITAHEQIINWHNKFNTMRIVQPGSSIAIIRSCKQSGSDSASENCLGLSPAICPSGWNYNAIARVTHSSTVATTVFCCPRFVHLSRYCMRDRLTELSSQWLSIEISPPRSPARQFGVLKPM